MDFQTILAQPAAALREMSYEKFAELFTSVNEQIEALEEKEGNRRFLDFAFGIYTVTTAADLLERMEKLSQLRIARQNLTMHRHYVAYCEAQDRKHWDSVYHRPLPA